LEKSVIRVVVVDDHPIVRLGISAMVNSQPDMTVVGQAAIGQDAIRIFHESQPDIVLVDLRLPDMGGVEVIRTLCRSDPGAKFIVLTTYDGDEDIFQALEAGAAGYLIKGMSHEVLLKGLRQVHKGKQYVPTEVSQKLSARNPHAVLSDRERQVLQLIAQGSSNKAIASSLGITEGTVKCHVGVILEQLNVTDRTQAVLAALRRGLVHL
jgi:DNA-binding NarL/FixJ family response regulator